MGKLSIKRDRVRAKQLVEQYLAEHVVLSERPAKPRPKSLQTKDVKISQPEVLIPGNADQFAAKGDEWGALRPIPHQLPYRKRTHPDGFVEYQLRHEDDYDVGPLVRPCDTVKVKPKPKPKPRFTSLARLVHNEAVGQNLAQLRKLVTVA